MLKFHLVSIFYSVFKKLISNRKIYLPQIINRVSMLGVCIFDCTYISPDFEKIYNTPCPSKKKIYLEASFLNPSG